MIKLAGTVFLEITIGVNLSTQTAHYQYIENTNQEYPPDDSCGYNNPEIIHKEFDTVEHLIYYFKFMIF